MPSDVASMNIFSQISVTSLVADTVHPSGADSRRGRLSHDASCFVSLSWAMNTQRSELFPLSFPSSQPASVLASGCEDIDPRPDFGGRTALEMLMGPEVIIDGSDIMQGWITRYGIANGVRYKQPFHGADEPLDAAVLPWASRIAVLQANAHQSEHHRKTPRREDGFVIGAQESRAAILTARGGQMIPNRQRRSIRQSLHAETGAARMVQDGQHDMLAAVGIGLCQQVHASDQIARHWAGHSIFHLPSRTEDRILLPSDCVGDVDFADRHAAAFGEATIEAMGNDP
jgi:hypothetical protein